MTKNGCSNLKESVTSFHNGPGLAGFEREDNLSWPSAAAFQWTFKNWTAEVRSSLLWIFVIGYVWSCWKYLKRSISKGAKHVRASVNLFKVVLNNGEEKAHGEFMSPSLAAAPCGGEPTRHMTGSLPHAHLKVKHPENRWKQHRHTLNHSDSHTQMCGENWWMNERRCVGVAGMERSERETREQQRWAENEAVERPDEWKQAGRQSATSAFRCVYDLKSVLQHSTEFNQLFQGLITYADKNSTKTGECFVLIGWQPRVETCM